jgi:hypothetical protein
MGTENLFHRRRAKALAGLERNKTRRASYDKVLIVCEGEKTEPNYFNELINFYKLNTANVEIDGTCGSSPKSVFERALKLYQNEKSKGDAFDKVYCVFDKDSHDTYDETLVKISSQKPQKVFHAAISVPCFEYWLLLHFQYTTKPYHATGSSSIGNEVLKDLKYVFPEYAKGSEYIFDKLLDQLEFAKANAQRSLEHGQANHSDNPTTYIHELVNYLQNLQ